MLATALGTGDAKSGCSFEFLLRAAAIMHQIAESARWAGISMTDLCLHIVRFCVRGAERARTFVVAAAQAAWMAGTGRRRA